MSYGLMAVAAALSFVVNAPPTAFTAAIIATAMPAAIKPYSMAVAPDSLLRKRDTKLSMEASTCKLHPDRSPKCLTGSCRERGDAKRGALTTYEEEPLRISRASADLFRFRRNPAQTRRTGCIRRIADR